MKIFINLTQEDPLFNNLRSNVVEPYLRNCNIKIPIQMMRKCLYKKSLQTIILKTMIKMMMMTLMNSNKESKMYSRQTKISIMSSFK